MLQLTKLIICWWFTNEGSQRKRSFL